MKTKRLTALLLALFLLFSVAAQAAPEEEPPEELTVNAKAAFLAETTTGQILFEYHADDKLYPASTTKMMTALVAWEHCAQEDMIPVSETAVEGLAERGSSVFLQVGEQMNFMDMLRYLLIGSGNDAANALAEYVAGSGEAFAELMNQKAAQLGCENTHFSNPHGLHEEDHYTSARDLYKIGKALIDVPELREIVSTSQVKLQPTNMHPNESTITTTNHLISRLKDTRYFDKNAFGIKTGTTTPAGFCLVGGETNGDLEYISVILGGEKDPDTGDIGCYTETLKLFRYARQNYSLEVLSAKDSPVQEVDVRFAAGKEHTKLAAAQDTTALVAKDLDLTQLTYEVDAPSSIDAPVEKGQKIGSARLMIDGVEYGQVDLVASESIPRSDALYVVHQIQEFFSGTVFKVILAALLAFVFLLILIASNRRRLRRKRRARRRQYPQDYHTPRR